MPIVNLLKATQEQDPNADVEIIEQIFNFIKKDSKKLTHSKYYQKTAIAAAENIIVNNTTPDLIAAVMLKDYYYKTGLSIEKVKKNFGSEISNYIRAYEFSEKVYQGMLRTNGKSYFDHLKSTALTLAELKLSLPTISAALLHDIPYHSIYTSNDIKKIFGKEISYLVAGVTKLNSIKYKPETKYVKNMRRMFLAMSQDIRIAIIKFAERIDTLKNIEEYPLERRTLLAKEALEVYAPIAGLLGIWKLRWQLEDLAFKFLMNEEYQTIAQRFHVQEKENRDLYIKEIKEKVEIEAKKRKINCQVSGRFKHFYSIYQKMNSRDKKFNEIYDVFALTVTVDSEDDCYRMLGIIHNLWKPKTRRVKDYIANPKPNGYQSLHTTVFGPNARMTEFQIKTIEMHEKATYGIAAHWYYKTRGQKSKNPEWVKDLLAKQQLYNNDEEFLEKLKIDVLKNRVFIYTPKGDIISLPEGSTPVDFAYAIHTEIGDKCYKALVNEREAPLDYCLSNEDLVEIITDENQTPQKEWLNFVKTNNANEKINVALNKNNINDNQPENIKEKSQ